MDVLRRTFVFILWITSVFVSISGDTAQRSQTVSIDQKALTCEGGTMILQCPPNMTIDIKWANYGRYNLSPCNRRQRTDYSTRCMTIRSLSIVSERCSGQQACVLQAQNDLFGDPCYGTKKYLEVEYSCRPRVPIDQKALTCEGGTMNLQCPPNMRIHIRSANYGRYNLSTCNRRQRTDYSTQCMAISSLSIVSERCSGQQTCVLQAQNDLFHGDPCYGTKKYLEVEYSCRPRAACPTPPVILNSKIDTQSATNIKYSCKAGYQARVRTTATCTDGPNWVFADNLRLECSRVNVTCAALSDPTNGKVANVVGTTGKYEYNYKYKYTCNSEFMSNGRQTVTVTCQASGKWTEENIECKEGICLEPQAPANGFLRGSGNEKYAAREFRCFDNATMDGKRSGYVMRYCQEDGQWTESQPTCTLKPGVSKL